MKKKTRKSLAKRVKITKNGKVLFRKKGMRHLRRKKSKKQIRRGKTPQKATGKRKDRILKILGEK